MRPTYVQPSTRVRQTLGRVSPSGSRSRAGIAVSRRIVSALTRKVAALTYSARSTAAISGQGVVEHARQQRQAGEDDRGDRRRAVRREEAELVGRLEPLPRHQVGDRGLLGRDPDQAGDLDEERRDEQPGEGADQRDGQEQREPGDVADHHRQAPVQPVGDDAGDRADQDGGGEPQDEDAGDRDVGGRVAVVGQPGRERGQREQAEPVAEAGQRQRGPEPAEGRDEQHRAQVVVGDHDRARRPCLRAACLRAAHAGSLSVTQVRTVAGSHKAGAGLPSGGCPSSRASCATA